MASRNQLVDRPVILKLSQTPGGHARNHRILRVEALDQQIISTRVARRCKVKPGGRNLVILDIVYVPEPHSVRFTPLNKGRILGFWKFLLIIKQWLRHVVIMAQSLLRLIGEIVEVNLIFHADTEENTGYPLLRCRVNRESKNCF